MSRIRRGWALTKKSWGLLREHRELVRFPLYGAAATIVCAVDRRRPGPLPDRRRQVWFGGPLAGDRLLPAGVDRLLLQRRPRGRRRHDLPRPRGDGRRRPRRGAQPLLADLPAGRRSRPSSAWCMSALENQGGIVGRSPAACWRLAWSLVTFLAVPVIAIEGTGPFETLKRSASLFKSRWGQQITGNIAIGGAVFLFGILPSALLIARRPDLGLGELRRRPAGRHRRDRLRDLAADQQRPERHLRRRPLPLRARRRGRRRLHRRGAGVGGEAQKAAATPRRRRRPAPSSQLQLGPLKPARPRKLRPTSRPRGANFVPVRLCYQ